MDLMAPGVIGAFAAASVTAVVATWLVRRWALRFGLVDLPDGARKLHDCPVPRIGGVAIYVAVVAATSLGVLVLKPTEMGSIPVVPLISAAGLVFAIGLWDDVRGLTAGRKLLLEVMVAVGVFAYGVRISEVAMPGGEVAFPLWMSLLVTIAWIVGITNAFNLLDGSDGIAAGAALFASCSMAAVSALTGNLLGVIVGVALAGATLGFLYFNFPPASIFLGDSGSLFLGFMLAALGIITTQKASTALAVAIPVVSCGLPILDTMLAMARRFLRGRHIFSPDRGHIHHRLRDLGHSPRKVALLLYVASAGFALLSLVLVGPKTPVLPVLFVIAGAIVWLGVQRLRIPEILELRRIVHRGCQQRRVIAANVTIREALADLASAQEPTEVVAALRTLVGTGEFGAAELSIPRSLGRRFLEEAGGVRATEGHVTCRVRPPHAPASPLVDPCELRLAIRDDRGSRVGCLSLWLATDRQHVLADLTMVTRDFSREVNAAILRIASADRQRRLKKARERIASASRRKAAPVGTAARAAPAG